MAEPLDPAAAHAALHYGLANALGKSPQESDDMLLRTAREEHHELLRLRGAVVVLPRETRRRLRPRKGAGS